MAEGESVNNLRRGLRISFYTLASLIILFVLILGCCGFYQYHSAIDESNALLYDWKKSNWISGKDLPVVTKAILAAEDPTYFTEPKLNCGPYAFIKALSAKEWQDCSPLISQAARLVTPEKYKHSLGRNFAGISIQSELSKTPDGAVDVILNRAYLGVGKDGIALQGFAQASEFYFGQAVNKLNISKAALLAGMLQAPSRYSPKENIERAKERRDLVIDKMAKVSFISESEAVAAKNESLQ